MDSGLDPSHIHSKPLPPKGQESHSISERCLQISCRPLLDDSPEVISIIKGLGMSGLLPGFWCQLALAGSHDSLLVCSQNWRIWYTIFLPTIMVRILTAMQSTQEELQLCWTRKLKEGVKILGLKSGCVGGFPTWRPDLEAGSILWVICYLPVWGLVLLAGAGQSAPKGPNSFPEPLFRFCCGTEACAVEGSRSRLETVEDSRKLPV